MKATLPSPVSRVSRNFRQALIGMVACALPCTYAIDAAAAATFLGPSEYLAFDNTLPGAGTAISPFSSLSFSYFYLETFEDALFNVPGVTQSGGSITGPGGITDSVDADDDVIDGSGVNGHSFYGSGASGITFNFSATVLGALPTHVGIVWTDGASYNTVTFEAWDASGESLGAIVASGIGDGNFASGTAEDRFFGVIAADGISKIFIKSPGMAGSFGSGIEVDHLQYGLTAAIPEPETHAMLLAGLGLLGWHARHRKNKQAS
jgi:hypothetical protein